MSDPPRPVPLPTRGIGPALPAVLGATALWASGAGTGSVAAWAAAAACVWGATSLSALGVPTVRGGGRALVGGAAFTAATAAAGLAVLPWLRAQPETLRALAPWVAHGLAYLLPAILLLALGGWACGRLVCNGGIGQTDPVHWLLGALGIAALGIVLGTVGALAGPWGARGAAAVLASVAGAFWPWWATVEAGRRPGPRARYRPTPAAARRLRALGRRRRPATSAGDRGPATAARTGGHPPLPRVVPPRRRRRRRPRWGRALRAAWERQRRRAAQALGGLWRQASLDPEEGGALPVAVRLVSARANTLRLIALYACAGLCGGPALLFLLMGPRAAWMWLLPQGLPVAGRVLVLVAAVVAPAACVAVALRTRLLHPIELALPVPPWRWTAIAAAGTVLLLALGAAAAEGPGRNVAGALLLAHRVPVVALFACVLLPVAQAAFYFGLLQARLAEVLPAWEAVTLVAAAFALSGPLTGAPLPGFLLTLLLGIWLGWCRGAIGVTGVALSFALGNAVALGMVLRV